MRHILLAASIIGAVSALALSILSKPIADFNNDLKTLPTSYSALRETDPGADEAFALNPSDPDSVAPGDFARSAASSVESIAPRQRVERVRRGDTLMTVMSRAGGSPAEAHATGRALRHSHHPKPLRT